MLAYIEEALSSPLEESLYKELYKLTDPIAVLPIDRWMTFKRTNHDPITFHQLDDLKVRFKFVDVRAVEENFSRKFADFLIKAIDHYKIDCTKYSLVSDFYEDNKITSVFIPDTQILCNFSMNLQGDVQDPALSEGDSQFAILHELRHIQQWFRGWLGVDSHSDLTWQGQRIFIQPALYALAPHEYDANRFALGSPLRTDKTIVGFRDTENTVLCAPQAQKNRWSEHGG